MLIGVIWFIKFHEDDRSILRYSDFRYYILEGTRSKYTKLHRQVDPYGRLCGQLAGEIDVNLLGGFNAQNHD